MSAPVGDARAPCLVVMGVSGCGKTTLGMALARALEVDFVEGDALHPPANLAKMAAGRPLDDADRAPWLAAVAQALRRTGARRGVVAACSALKRAYRDHLRLAQPRTVFVLPEVDEAALFERLTSRRSHFMPPSLLRSQLDVFEPPGKAEAVIRVDGGLPPPDQVARVLEAFAARRAA